MMDSTTQALLAESLDLLRQVDQLAVSEGVSHHFLEIKTSIDNREVVVNGNTFGLAHVAKSILEVATATFDGAHHQLDETGIADHADIAIVVTMRSNKVVARN
jgi:hypothetical protein